MKTITNKFNLTKEEQEYLAEIENGNYRSVENLEEWKSFIMKAIDNTIKDLGKDKTITLRVSHSVLGKIKLKAASKGLRYQTYIGALLYRDAMSRD